ncbi:type II toxin-antitoxin system PemK/MazF family toxin [Sphaerisporangium fuscum]|uniref:type II toxin-antitoxin system PemK/MazF family toxin n=1 Tax=Sphaerisporangium fuscum TaxID=2835868 RepID=UPI001BDC7F27|nr:type II toxin-antitoxin system PemK/MazF family toxin [Sphaerisporangium fuscum]
MVSAQSGAVLLACAAVLVAAVVVAALLVRRASTHRAPKASVPGRRTSRPSRRRGARPPAGPGRRTPSVHSRPPSPAWESRPAPGQIWWADVPYSDGSGSKVRPCLVVRTHPRGAEVLKITSQDKSQRDDHFPIPTRSWDRDAVKDSWLDVSEPHFVADRGFRNLAAKACDARTWQRVTRVQATGWVYDD